MVFSHISYKTCLYKPSLKKSDDNIFLERKSINLKELTIKPDNQDEIKNIISNIRKHFRNNYVIWKPVYYNVFARIWDISDNRLSDFEEYFFHLYQKPPPFLPRYKILHGRAKAFTQEAIRSFGKKKSIFLSAIVDDYSLIYEGDFLKRRESGKFHNSLLHEVVIDHYPCYHIKMVGKDKKEIWNLFVEKSTYALVKIEFNNIQNKGKDTGVVNFQQVKGKWYLKSSRNSYTLVAYPKDVTNRLCVYSWMNKEPLDGYVGIFRAAGIHLSKFSSGFDSKFWKNNVVIPIPQQIKSQVK